MDHPLDGINEKLKRTEENILNLNREIGAFLETGMYRTIADDDDDLIQKFIHYHSSRPIPKRFSVIIGESVYHLRSSLDHLIWQLVLANGGQPDPKRTTFPIYNREPATKDEAARYDRKIQGVSPRSRTLIDLFQPYQLRNTRGRDTSLWIVHEMNVIDKHRELVLAVTYLERTTTIRMFPDSPAHVRVLHSPDPAKSPDLWPNDVKVDGKLAAHVAFRKFGRRENQPVIPSLIALARDVTNLIREFASEFP